MRQLISRRQQRACFLYGNIKNYTADSLFYCAFAIHHHLIVRFASHSTKHSRHKTRLSTLLITQARYLLRGRTVMLIYAYTF